MTRAQDFGDAIRGGARAGCGTVVLHVRLCESDGSTGDVRIGFIVNKSVGTAVVRNRVRRRLRHHVRTWTADLPAGARVVVRALPPAAASSTTDLAADVESCVRRALRKAERAVAP